MYNHATKISSTRHLDLRSISTSAFYRIKISSLLCQSLQEDKNFLYIRNIVVAFNTTKNYLLCNSRVSKSFIIYRSKGISSCVSLYGESRALDFFLLVLERASESMYFPSPRCLGCGFSWMEISCFFLVCRREFKDSESIWRIYRNTYKGHHYFSLFYRFILFFFLLNLDVILNLIIFIWFRIS